VEGSGDEPDSQSHALSTAYNADWRAKIRKVVVLITNLPLHIIGEDRDKFSEGCPLVKSYFCSSVRMDQPLMPN
jgi:hypothetical protein